MELYHVQFTWLLLVLKAEHYWHEQGWLWGDSREDELEGGTASKNRSPQFYLHPKKL